MGIALADLVRSVEYIDGSFLARVRRIQNSVRSVHLSGAAVVVDETRTPPWHGKWSMFRGIVGDPAPSTLIVDYASRPIGCCWALNQFRA